MKSQVSIIAKTSLFLATLFGLAIGQTSLAQQPLKVFILAGQSNMQGHAHIRTLDHIGMDESTAPMLNEIQDESGAPKTHSDVWISYLSAGGEKHGQLTTGFGADDNKIGPELTFGIYLKKQLNEPILIIKTAWGGKSIHTDFRSPSAGPYEFSEQQLEQFAKQDKDLDEIKKQKSEATGHYYRLMVEHVNKVLSDIKRVYPDYQPENGYEISGFVWFQGWNDMVDRGVYPNRDQQGGYDDYSVNLAHFIRDVRRDFKAPEMPFVIGVMGAGGPVSKYLPDQKRYAKIHQNFRDAMAAPSKLAEFDGNVSTVLTENCWDQELTLLRSREGKLRGEFNKLKKDGKIAKADERATMEKMRTDEFSERELNVLAKGVSNAEYHYLGSAKIMACIGKSFAKAIAEFQND